VDLNRITAGGHFVDLASVASGSLDRLPETTPRRLVEPEWHPDEVSCQAQPSLGSLDWPRWVGDLIRDPVRRDGSGGIESVIRPLLGDQLPNLMVVQLGAAPLHGMASGSLVQSFPYPGRNDSAQVDGTRLFAVSGVFSLRLVIQHP
jgi:hypothetical protein